ncbi:TetR/AcrR family transcriptional regulator [Paenibacillus illinoisensis]|uniref:Transcriptional regulator TetR family protein n=1 Tax=Paenibacillus illinoisensis TaxID=59845 RepID=A0A2W0C5J8_9BACL|nr:TetR/AcrR family transcriptional regulator [Paenibacillus illinoisensis]PYY27903.1 Transcriptional regulator TetR family protein [Paenibacillus illinoisensis]
MSHENGKEYSTEEKRGRPLDLSRNKVILEETLKLLAEKGYDLLTIEAVANQSKVGKGTIYRRWSSKMELVIDATRLINPIEVSINKLNRNQDLRGQLIDLLNLLFTQDNKKYQKAINAICNALNEQLDQGMRDAFYWSYRNVITSILQPYVKEYQLTDDDIELIADIGPALVMYNNIYVRNQSNNVQYIERIVDKLMMPIVLKQV